jgi:hypothetical protein
MRDFLIGILALAIAAAFLCRLVALVGCADCRAASVRCADDVLEVCDGDGDWRTAEDCGEIEPGSWACCELDAGAECVPEEECDE